MSNAGSDLAHAPLIDQVPEWLRDLSFLGPEAELQRFSPPVPPRAKFVEFTFKGRRTLGAAAAHGEQAKLLVDLVTERAEGIARRPYGLVIEVTASSTHCG